MSEVRESLLGKAGRLVRRRPILCVASTLVLAVVIVVVAFVAYAGYFVYRLHVLHGQRVEKTFVALEGYGGADAFYEKCKKIASRLPFDEGMSFTGMRLRQGDSSTENGRSNDMGCIWRELSELDPQYVVKESGSKCLVIQVSGGFMHMGLVVALGDDYLGTDKFPAVWDASGDWSWKRLGKYVWTLGRHPIFVSLFSADFINCRRLSQFLQISPLPFFGHYAIILPFLGIEHRRRTDTRGNHGESAG